MATDRYCSECGSQTATQLVDGIARPVCTGCGRIHFRDPKVAAAAVIQEEGKVLLVQRSNSPEKGTWTLPAGYVDAGEDPREAAIREVAEETGLQVRLAGLLDVLFEPVEAERPSTIVIVYQAEVVGGALRAGDDAAQAGFFALENLPRLGFRSTRSVLDRLRQGDPSAL